MIIVVGIYNVVVFQTGLGSDDTADAAQNCSSHVGWLAGWLVQPSESG
jgi:hypothetical protein